MKKTTLLILVLLSTLLQVQAQKYITKNGKITFFSDGPLEKIEAINNKVNAAIDAKSGLFVFKVLIKSFVFEKALMQEHFNENYLESDKFPVAVFKGKITNLDQINFSAPGNYPAKVEGDLTIHGQTRPIKTTGTFNVTKEGVNGKSAFTIKIADYGIKIPGAVTGKIAEEILINVDINLKAYKK